MHDRIFLVGYRGVGKTTIGCKLAEQLEYDFFDTDQYICEKVGQQVRAIVQKGGWDTFRQHEETALRELGQGNKRVISTGGGAVLHRHIWSELRGTSTVIWLWAEKEIILKRLSSDSTTGEMRPSLTGKGLQDELDEVLSKREPLYAGVSHIKIDTGRMSVEETIATLVYTLLSGQGIEE